MAGAYPRALGVLTNCETLAVTNPSRGAPGRLFLVFVSFPRYAAPITYAPFLPVTPEMTCLGTGTLPRRISSFSSLPAQGSRSPSYARGGDGGKREG